MESDDYEYYDFILRQLSERSKLLIHLDIRPYDQKTASIVLMELVDEHLLSYDSSSGYGFYNITTAGLKHLNSNVGYKALRNGKAEKERIDLEIKRLTLSDLQHSVKTNSLTFYLLVLGGILGLLSFIMQIINQK